MEDALAGLLASQWMQVVLAIAGLSGLFQAVFALGRWAWRKLRMSERIARRSRRAALREAEAVGAFYRRISAIRGDPSKVTAFAAHQVIEFLERLALLFLAMLIGATTLARFWEAPYLLPVVVFMANVGLLFAVLWGETYARRVMAIYRFDAFFTECLGTITRLAHRACDHDINEGEALVGRLLGPHRPD